MASMDDLIATINGGLHAGQNGNDLKDLHAKLAQTLQATKAPYRPIPPPTITSPASANGPLPPPAPASSWNDSLASPSSGQFSGLSSSPYATRAQQSANAWGGMGNSPRQGGAGMFQAAKKETGFSIPPPKNQSNGSSHSYNSNNSSSNRPQNGEGNKIPYHASVLPMKASPKDTGGFGDDAFKSLWSTGKN